jgi:Rhodanese-related sulfurtransferase
VWTLRIVRVNTLSIFTYLNQNIEMTYTFKKTALIAAIAFSLPLFSFAKDVILDVRTPKEFAEEHVPNAVNVDFLNPNFKTEIQKLDKADSYKVYCRSGRRSGQAIIMMKQLGFKNIENVGGLEDAKKTLNAN